MNKFMRLASVTLVGATMALVISGTALAQGPVDGGAQATGGNGRRGVATSGMVAGGGMLRTQDCEIADGAEALMTQQRAGHRLGGWTTGQVLGNRATGGLGLGYVDADGDGINDRSQGAGGTCEFVDADGDGVCDCEGDGEPVGGAFGRSNR